MSSFDFNLSDDEVEMMSDVLKKEFPLCRTEIEIVRQHLLSKKPQKHYRGKHYYMNLCFLTQYCPAEGLGV